MSNYDIFCCNNDQCSCPHRLWEKRLHTPAPPPPAVRAPPLARLTRCTAAARASPLSASLTRAPSHSVGPPQPGPPDALARRPFRVANPPPSPPSRMHRLLVALVARRLDLVEQPLLPLEQRVAYAPLRHTLSPPSTRHSALPAKTATRRRPTPRRLADSLAAAAAPAEPRASEDEISRDLPIPRSPEISRDLPIQRSPRDPPTPPEISSHEIAGAPAETRATAARAAREASAPVRAAARAAAGRGRSRRRRCCLRRQAERASPVGEREPMANRG